MWADDCCVWCGLRIATQEDDDRHTAQHPDNCTPQGECWCQWLCWRELGMCPEERWGDTEQLLRTLRNRIAELEHERSTR